MTVVVRLTGLVVAAALLAAIFYWYARPASEVKPVIFRVKNDDFTVKLTELGELRALESVTILAQKDGPIAFLVPEGTYAEPGDVLVRFDSSQYEVALTRSKVELLAAQAELRGAEKALEAQREQLRAEHTRLEGEVRLAEIELANLQRKPFHDELEKARLELEKAKVTFKNAEKKVKALPELVRKGFITRSTLDEAELSYLATKANLQIAQFTFDKVSAGAPPEELEKARVRLRQAQAALERADRGMRPLLQAAEATVERQKAHVARAENLIEKAKAELAKTVLRAVQAGLVVYAKASAGSSSAKVHLGMMAFAGQPLLYLPDTSTMVVDVEVNEVDIRKINPGAPAELRLGAYPDGLFHGRVLDISRLARPKRNRPAVDSKIKVFDVTVQIEETDPRLKPGSTATVDIILDRQRDVVSIPLSAVVTRGEEHVVLVVNAGEVKERKIIVGLSNEHYAVVKEGLRPGEQVMLAPSPSGL